MESLPRKATLSVIVLSFFVLLVSIGAQTGGPDPSVDRSPGREVLEGDPALWDRGSVKALDPVYDGASGRDGLGDLMGFYFDQGVDRLSVRINLYRPPGTPEDTPLLGEGVRAFVLFDYMDGGAAELPGGVPGTPPHAWDRAIELYGDGGGIRARIRVAPVAASDDASLRRYPGGRASVLHARGSHRWTCLEASITLPGGFKEAVCAAAGATVEAYGSVAASVSEHDNTPIGFYIFTTDGQRVLDEITATNEMLSNPHNVAFMHHLNQGLTYTTVFRGERGEAAAYDGDPNNPDDGADELLAAHDYYNLPLNWHQGGLLISAAEWHDPAFNDWLAAGVTAGRYEIISSALGQQMMPFIRDEINGKSVSVENDMIQTHYGYTPRVAWVPERVWCENPDVDGNGTDASANVIDYIGDDFTDNGIWAVLLDDYIHCEYNNGPLDDHHIYTYNAIKVLPMDGDFVGQMNWNAGDAWNTILAGTSDEIIIYGNDAEIAAEVSQGAGNPDALNNYIWVLQQCANAGGSVGVWKLTDVLQDPGFTTQPLLLQNGTYGLLGGHGGYGGGNNSWYGDWAGYTGDSNLDGHDPKWNYGTQWDFTLTKILSVPANNISEMAWYVLMTNLHETGWHDGGEISGWQHHYSNHIRSGNAHAEAARWAGGLYVDPAGAYTSDFDDDGVDELVLYNDRLLAVFDGIGGKLQWLFCKGSGYNYSVVSNDNVYWVDTDGDYNETNHVAALSDVSVGGIDRENDFYSFNVTDPVGNTVGAEIVHPSVTKTVSLTLGYPYLKVQYRASGERVYVKSGFTPDNLDLTWSGQSLERIWDPDGGGYFGQKNTNTDATAAIIVGTAGATHNFQFSATLLEGDELYGDSPFEVWVYGGYTSPTDIDGHIPELKALRDSLVDVMGPSPLSGTYYPATDHLVLYFDEEIDASTVVVTGISLDDDDDGIPDVSLTVLDSLTTTGFNKRLNFDLSAVTAASIEALTEPIELMLAANTVQDDAGNGNEAVTNADDVPVEIAPVTKYQIDGWLSDSEWSDPRVSCEDYWDSSWNGTAPGDTNEINVLFVDWDSTYLYLGIRGHVQGNSWILYLDTDVDGPEGYTDLTAIDTWERGATFSAAGFKVDYQYGAYQHQGPYDSQSMWHLTSDTTSENMSAQIFMAFDPQHIFGYDGGSELAIPWDVLYGLGPGQVPVGTSIGVVASVCWDPEPDGELGGDSTPSNVAATLPAIDTFCVAVVDSDNDGVPDPPSTTDVPEDGFRAVVRVLSAYPNPSRSMVRVPMILGSPSAGGSERYNVQAVVYDVAGRTVRTIFNGHLPAGRHLFSWNGRTRSGRPAAAGIYFLRVMIDGKGVGTTKILRLL
ncbi:MAG: T9SS type A sorting domain-containing protein [bacterium]|nr:MAG: T9SS type A sorting domain-containing protein [bacterium]